MKLLIKEMDKIAKYFIVDEKGVMAKKTAKSGKYSEWDIHQEKKTCRLLV